MTSSTDTPDTDTASPREPPSLPTARSARPGRRRANWAAGAVAAVATVVGLFAVFVIATLYWGEGVLDAGGTETVRSSLFPFFGSRVGISPADDGVAWSMETGPLPFVSACVVWFIVTRPWRSLRRYGGGHA